MPPAPARRLGGQPVHGGRRGLFQHGPQGEAPLADPVPGTRRVRAGRQAPPGQDETAPDRGGEHIQHGVQAVTG
jgi:hypothetical protein